MRPVCPRPLQGATQCAAGGCTVRAPCSGGQPRVLQEGVQSVPAGSFMRNRVLVWLDFIQVPVLRQKECVTGEGH